MIQNYLIISFCEIDLYSNNCIFVHVWKMNTLVQKYMKTSKSLFHY